MIEKLKAYLRLANIPFDEKQPDNTHLFFSISGMQFLAEYDSAQDPTYFRLMLPAIDTIDDNNEIQLLRHATNITTKYKVGKIIRLGDSLWITIDNFVYGEWDANPLFARDIAVARDMLNDYRNLQNDKRSE